MSIAQNDHGVKHHQDTQEFLRQNPLPPELAHFQPTMEQLPLGAVLDIIFQSVPLGLDIDAISDALHNAVAFQNEESYRCPVCFKWQREPYMVIGAKVNGKVSFYGVCKRCARKHRTVESLQDAMRPYVTEGAQQ